MELGVALAIPGHPPGYAPGTYLSFLLYSQTVCSDLTSRCFVGRSAGGILPMGSVQRKLSGPRPTYTNGDGSLRTNEVRPLHARRSRQCRLLGGRPALSRLEMFRPPTMPDADSGRRPPRSASLSQGADAVPGSELLLHRRFTLLCCWHSCCHFITCGDSGVERIDQLRFLAGCRTRRLNQALSVLPLSLVFPSVSIVLLTRATFCVVLLCVIFVFSLLVVLVRLSVPVQVIDWKDSSPK